jgi:hypothetical protein
VLTRLVVRPCCVTIGAFLSRLPQLAPSLTCLDLSGCGGLSGADLQQLLAQMKGLERLLLDGIEEVGGIVTMLAGSGGVQLKYGRHQQSDARMQPPCLAGDAEQVYGHACVQVGGRQLGCMWEAIWLCLV